MSNNWAFINFYFFTSENFPGIQSKVFKVKTFLIYLQLWIWNFAHFFSYKKIKKRRCFFIHPSLLSATRPVWRPGCATSFSCQNLPLRLAATRRAHMHDDEVDDKKGRFGRALIIDFSLPISKRLREQGKNPCDLNKYIKRQQKINKLPPKTFPRVLLPPTLLIQCYWH